MLQHNYQIIRAVLENEIDALTASKLHLEHQLKLPQRFRIIELEEKELEDSLRSINHRLADLQDAIFDLNKEHGSPKPVHSSKNSTERM